MTALPQPHGERINQFIDSAERQGVGIANRVNETVDTEEFVVHQGDIFQEHVIRYHLVIMLVGITVDQ